MTEPILIIALIIVVTGIVIAFAVKPSYDAHDKRTQAAAGLRGS